MAEYNVRINVKNDTGYDQLYPETKSNIVEFDKSNSNLTSTTTEAAIKEINTKVNTATSTANTNKTNIGTLTSLTTDSKTNLVGAINEVDSHANTATSTSNTNKTNIGTLSNLKTSIKTNIVNAINNLYDNTIGKTLKNLDEVNLTTESGFLVDALAIKELNNNLEYFEENNSGCIRIKDKQIQICFGRFSANATLNQNGTGYTGNSSSISNGTFVKPFNLIYSLNITQRASDWVMILRKEASQTAITSITLGYFTQYSNKTFEFDYIAIGTYSE